MHRLLAEAIQRLPEGEFKNRMTQIAKRTNPDATTLTKGMKKILSAIDEFWISQREVEFKRRNESNNNVLSFRDAYVKKYGRY
jgi:hypothetical protein